MPKRVGFDEFYRAYHRRVRGLAARKFGEDAADDIAQEAMLRAWRHYARLDAERSPWPWLAVVTQNVGINHVHAGRRVVTVDAAVIEELSEATDDVPAEEAAAADVRRILGQAMHRLSERDRSALAMYELDGVPVSDIATRLGTSPNVIRQRLFRARRHLADHVQALGGRSAAAPPWWLPGRLLYRAGSRFAESMLRGSPALREDVARAAAAALLLLATGPATAPSSPTAPAHSVAAGALPSSGDLAGLPGLDGVADRVGAALDATGPDPRDLASGLLGFTGDDQCLTTRSTSVTCPVTRLAGTDPVTVPTDAVRTSLALPSADGTSLHADVLLPAGSAGRHPVILAVGPDLSGELRYPELWTDGRIFQRGYAYVQVGLRGRGGSAGCADYGGPGEQADVAAAVRWAATQPWSTGRVAVWGLSYDAWAGVMALAANPQGLAAVVLSAPSTGLRSSLYTSGGVRYAAGLWPVTHGADAGRCTPPVAAMQDPDAGTAFWRERDLLDRAGRSTVPVLWAHGFADAVAPAGPAASLFARLRGPKQGWLGQYAHGVPRDPAVARRWFTATQRWLDVYVAGRPGGAGSGFMVQSGDGTWRAEPQWPPADARTWSLPLREGLYADTTGNHGESASCRGQYGPGCGVGSWTFSEPLPYDLHLAGAARLRLDAPAVALLYDVDPDGKARLVARGASAGSAGSSVDLAPQDWRFQRGHRIGVLLTGSDVDWYLPVHSSRPIPVGSVVLEAVFRRLAPRPPLARGSVQAEHWPFRLPAGLVADRQSAMPLPPPMD